MKKRGGVERRSRWRRSIKDRLSLLVQRNHLSQSFCDSFYNIFHSCSFRSSCCAKTLTRGGKPLESDVLNLLSLKNPMQTQRDPLVFIALDCHAVNMHLEWILAVRTQHWKVKVSDNGCTGYWGDRRELLAALDHFYVGIFIRTAGLRCISKRKTVHNGNRRVDGAT